MRTEESIFGNAKREPEKREIVVREEFAVTAKTVTPLLQIDENGGQRKRYVYEDGRTGTVPFFSANGLRGVLRRLMTAQQIRTAKKLKPDSKLDPEIFYLYANGGAFGKGKTLADEFLTPFTEEKVRKNAPILSIFGAGLSNLEGKLAVSDLVPPADEERFAEVEKDGKKILVSKFLGTDVFFRTNPMNDTASLWKPILNYGDVVKWFDEYTNIVAGEKEEKKRAKEMGIDVKEENSHVQQPVNMEFIIPGTKLVSSMNAKYGCGLTDVEKGALLSAFLDMSKMQMGSAKRIGFGVLDWRVEFGGKIAFEATSDENYVFRKKIYLSDEAESLIGEWEKWLEENALNIEDLKKLTE